MNHEKRKHFSMETTHPDVETYYPKVLDFIQGHDHLCISTIQRAVTHGFKLTCAIVDRLISEGHLRMNPNGGYDIVKSTATTPKTPSPIDAAIQLKDDELSFSEDGTVLLRVPNDATEVTIPEGVTMIGDEAFYGCTGLKSLTILSSEITIGEDAFEGCTQLKTVNLPKGLQKDNILPTKSAFEEEEDEEDWLSEDEEDDFEKANDGLVK